LIGGQTQTDRKIMSTAYVVFRKKNTPKKRDVGGFA
jgi:hypothetical protein